jgi:hypothetical protein
MAEQALDCPRLREQDEPKEPGATYRPMAPGRAADPGGSRALVIVCLIAGAVGWSWLGSGYAGMLRPHGPPNPDYFQDWASARNHHLGRPVYSPHTTTIPLYLGRAQDEKERDIEYNAHPPTSVLLALPLARQNFSDAMLAWNLVSLSTFLAALAIVAANVPELKTLFLPVAVLLPFCLPVYGTLQAGQLTFLLVLLVSSAWALDRSGRPATAGMLVGIAASVKLFPAYLVLYFAARRSWRAVFAAAASFAVLNLATAALLGWQTYRDYWQLVLPSQEKFRSYGFNLSLFGFWHKCFDPTSEHGAIAPLWYSPAAARCGTILSDLLVTAIIAIVTYRARTRDHRDCAFAMAVTALLLVSPVSWDYSLPLLLVPLAVAARAAMTSRWLAIVLIPILTILGLPQVTMLQLALAGQPLASAPPGFVLGIPSLNFYALVLTFGILAALGSRYAGPESP